MCQVAHRSSSHLVVVSPEGLQNLLFRERALTSSHWASEAKCKPFGVVRERESTPSKGHSRFCCKLATCTSRRALEPARCTFVRVHPLARGELNSSARAFRGSQQYALSSRRATCKLDLLSPSLSLTTPLSYFDNSARATREQANKRASANENPIYSIQNTSTGICKRQPSSSPTGSGKL